WLMLLRMCLGQTGSKPRFVHEIPEGPSPQACSRLSCQPNQGYLNLDSVQNHQIPLTTQVGWQGSKDQAMSLDSCFAYDRSCHPGGLPSPCPRLSISPKLFSCLPYLEPLKSQSLAQHGH